MREPHPITPDSLLPVLEALKRREPLFGLANAGADRAAIDALLVDDFWEVGASGGRYSRDFVLEVLEGRQRVPDDEQWDTRDHHCRDLGNAHYLYTYTLVQAHRVTRRASIWRWTEAGWKMVYHQGTVVQA